MAALAAPRHDLYLSFAPLSAPVADEVEEAEEIREVLELFGVVLGSAVRALAELLSIEGAAWPMLEVMLVLAIAKNRGSPKKKKT